MTIKQSYLPWGARKAPEADDNDTYANEYAKHLILVLGTPEGKGNSIALELTLTTHDPMMAADIVAYNPKDGRVCIGNGFSGTASAGLGFALKHAYMAITDCGFLIEGAPVNHSINELKEVLLGMAESLGFRDPFVHEIIYE